MMYGEWLRGTLNNVRDGTDIIVQYPELRTENQ